MTDKHEQDPLFSIFLMQQQQLAWLYLGKMANPATGKAERNLEAAKFTIDLLGMIEKKTEGNLSGDEQNLLGQVLTALRLNYLEEARRETEADAPADKAEGSEAGGAAGESDGDSGADESAGGDAESDTQSDTHSDAEPGEDPLSG